MTYMGTERRVGLDRRRVDRRAAATGRVVSDHPAFLSDETPGPEVTRWRVGEHERPLRLRDDTSLRSMAAPGLLIGAGLAALMDAAVFHHLLRWHHLASNGAGTGSMSAEDLVLDGLQQLLAGIAIAIGVMLLWNIGARRAHSAWRYAGSSMLGWVMLGWALFNIVFVTIPQWTIDRHHINVENDPLTWDLIFLAGTLIVGIVGLALVRSRRPLDLQDDDVGLDRWAD